ncbi:phosphoenolpyruvate--protein phosphotransferase [Magnetococcales bacterium HHB-1]
MQRTTPSRPDQDKNNTEQTIQGLGVSPGIVTGKAHLVERGMPDTPEYRLAPAQVKQEKKRFLEAIQTSLSQLEKIKQTLSNQEDWSQELSFILEAHHLILKDPTLHQGVLNTIDQHYNAEWAVKRHLNEISKTFAAVADPYLRDKWLDIEQEGKRILYNLTGDLPDGFATFQEPVILIAEDFTPADMVAMRRNKVLAFVTETGSATSHTAILARSMQIPAIVGAANVTQKVDSENMLIVDGVTGMLHINPSPNSQLFFKTRRSKFDIFKRNLVRASGLPTHTRDHHTVLLKANIAWGEDAKQAKDLGADGIGLFRTESLFMDRPTPPDEMEQIYHYHQTLLNMEGRPVTFRTMDLGGDKKASFLNKNGINSINPALGLRGVRLCLKEEQKLFRIQLRALLRAGADSNNMRLLFPLISGASELEMVLTIVEEVKNELKREHIAFAKQVALGAMIELPAAALCADRLAPLVDFLSIGTNDLIQFVLGIDRQNDEVSYLYNPTHPAVLQLIRITVEAGHAYKIPVTICGEMAADPSHAILLIGMGLDELSITADHIPLLNRIIRGIEYSQAKQVAEKVLQWQGPSPISKYLRNLLIKTFGEDYTFH